MRTRRLPRCYQALRIWGDKKPAAVTGVAAKPDKVMPRPKRSPNSHRRLKERPSFVSRLTRQLDLGLLFIPDRPIKKSMMLGAVYFLLGDSAPRDAFIASELKKRIGHHFSCWTDQHDIHSFEDRYYRRFRHRARAFRTFMAERPRQQPVILMGRSSGARVASFCASSCRADAVVCLGYPFRHPDKDQEPDRYQHLATIAIPTLILQGRSDPYGRADDISAYALSTSVCVQLIQTDHHMRLRPDEWDEAASTILAFCHDVLGSQLPVRASAPPPTPS